MTMLIVVAILIALMGFALARHWKVRADKVLKRAPRASSLISAGNIFGSVSLPLSRY